jgi:hypothetical protein
MERATITGRLECPWCDTSGEFMYEEPNDPSMDRGLALKSTTPGFTITNDDKFAYSSRLACEKCGGVVLAQTATKPITPSG